MRTSYYSKVILFGEYSMIFDATALMVPLQKFSARWKLSKLTMLRAKKSNESICRFRDYLADIKNVSASIDIDALSRDLNFGLNLSSNVPSGYGLGSSGTLVAAVYDRYAKLHTNDLMELKSIFGQMESYFHGSSSGIDPLQCYLGKPFRISPQGVELVNGGFLKRDIHICLIDTKIKSNTRPLVQHFKEQRQDEAFLSAFQRDYVPHVTDCINNLIDGSNEAFFASLTKLTKAQLLFLRPMITENTLHLFEQDYDFHFGVKISGSGGGGYVLGFTDDKEKAKQLLADFDTIWI
ncbi:MAG: hypothetical protein MJZ91_09065 [Bacteroidales bacterium]|nr:hypothetical protein [Bacteroidales bacterium]